MCLAVLFTIIFAISSAAPLLALLPVQAQTGSPQKNLQQYISGLHNFPRGSET
jgi:hypothetical protein